MLDNGSMNATEPVMQEIQILDEGGNPVGTAKAALHTSTENLIRRIVDPASPALWNFVERQFPTTDFLPVFLFEDIHIHPEHRRKRFGSRAFHEIADHYQELGARLGILRVATQGEDFYEGAAWRKQMYARLGWIELERHPEDKREIPFMFLPMVHRLIRTDPSTRLIRVSDEDIQRKPIEDTHLNGEISS
jgi:GNAT superfamily N-acetyltransferase